MGYTPIRQYGDFRCDRPRPRILAAEDDGHEGAGVEIQLSQCMQLGWNFDGLPEGIVGKSGDKQYPL